MPSLTKLSRPRPARDFPRTRLFRRLDVARGRRGVWVGGPPGAGKTTLVASYVERRGLDCLWYQVDEGDADVASFFYHLALAARRAAPRMRRPMPLLKPEHRAGLAVFARRFFQDLYRRLAPRFVLVIDNVQDVPADSPLHLALCEALDSVPEGAFAIVISRDGPPPGYARLQANRALGVLEPGELSLDAREVKGIADLWGLHHLAREEVLGLHERTQGWVAGLVLMLARHRVAGTAHLPTGSTPAVVFDYFAGEIFAHLDRAAQEVLLKTALLPKTTASMAVELTGARAAGSILAELDRKAYFVLNHEQREPVYEYHPLFREFLLLRGKEALRPEELAAARRAAAMLLRDRGQVEEALQLLRESRTWDAMSEMVLQQAPGMIETGRGDTLQRWVEALPEVVRRERPWLLYWLGAARLPLHPAQARQAFESAFEIFFDETTDAAGAYLSWAGIVDTYLYDWAEFAPLDRWIATFDLLRSRLPEFPSREVEARCTFGIFIALMYRQPQHPQLPAWRERVLALTLGPADPQLRITWGHHLLLHAIWCAGNLRQAKVVFDTLRPVVEAAHIAPLVSIVWQAMVARYHWMNGSAKQCLETVQAGLELSGASGIHLWDFMLHAQGVWGALVAGDLGRADEFARRMASDHGSDRPLNAIMCRDAEAHLALRRREPPLALEQSRVAMKLAERAGMPFALAVCHLTHAVAHLEQGDDARAASHLEEVRRIGAGMGYLEYLCLLPEAELALRRGDRRAALEALRQAAVAGRERGLFTNVWLRPETVAELYAEALANQVDPDFFRDLIRRQGLPPPERALEMERWPWMVTIRTLGGLAVTRDGQALDATAGARRKPVELLRALVAFGGNEVSEATLADALWPDAEGDAAQHALETNLYRLRRMLGDDRVVAVANGKVSVDARRTWVDSRAFERLVGRASAMLERRHAEAPPPLAEIDRLTDRILDLYRGPLLPEGDEPWLMAPRLRLRDKLVRLLTAAGKLLEGAGEPQRAIEHYRRAIEADPAADALYPPLMAAYRDTGQLAEATRLVRRCRELRAAAGAEPRGPGDTVFR